MLAQGDALCGGAQASWELIPGAQVGIVSYSNIENPPDEIAFNRNRLWTQQESLHNLEIVDLVNLGEDIKINIWDAPAGIDESEEHSEIDMRLDVIAKNDTTNIGSPGKADVLDVNYSNLNNGIKFRASDDDSFSRVGGYEIWRQMVGVDSYPLFVLGQLAEGRSGEYNWQDNIGLKIEFTSASGENTSVIVSGVKGDIEENELKGKKIRDWGGRIHTIILNSINSSDRVNITCDGNNEWSTVGASVVIGEVPYMYEVRAWGVSEKLKDDYNNGKFLSLEGDKKSIFLDTTPPIITITGVINNKAYNNTVTPLITITDSFLDESATYIKLNGVDYTSGTDITNDGTYILEIHAEDMAGNISNEQITFILDLTPPSPPTFNTLPSLTNIPTINITGLAEPESIVTLYRNNDQYDTGTAGLDSSFIFDNFNLNEGENIFTATAMDKAGNVSGVSDTAVVVLDNTEPEVVNAFPDNDMIFNTNSASISAVITDLGSGVDTSSVKIVLDGVEVGYTEYATDINTIGYSADNLSEGAHWWKITGKDLAGNEIQDTAHTFRVDTIRPTIVILSPGE